MNKNKLINWSISLKKHWCVFCVVLCGLIVGVTIQNNLALYEGHFLQNLEKPPVMKEGREPPDRRSLSIKKRKTASRRTSSSRVSSSEHSVSVQTSSASLHGAAPSSASSKVVLRPAASANALVLAPAVVPAAAPISQDSFPALDHTSFPVSKVPNWGAMRTPAEWDRTYDQMTNKDFVSVPRYDLVALQTPMSSLIKPLHEKNYPLITQKLVYSTRYFGAYDLDAGEWTGKHPGIDIKLAKGTPIGAIGGGRVQAVLTSFALGTHVIIEHHLPDGNVVFSIYGHLDQAWVKAGQDVKTGEDIGAAGNSGNSTSPHLHLQIDMKLLGETGVHAPYMPEEMPSKATADSHVWNPISFLRTYAASETAAATR